MLKGEDIKIDITSEEYKDKLLDKRDSFCKHNKYKNQKEWRIALYRGEKSTAAYCLELGDISDIVIWTQVIKMDKLFFRKIGKKFSSVSARYIRNTSNWCDFRKSVRTHSRVYIPVTKGLLIKFRTLGVKINTGKQTKKKRRRK